MMSEIVGTGTGTVKVVATEGRGHTPEELAGLALDKIMYVSKGADPIIRQQAEAFKESIRSILTYHLAKAQQSERTTLYNLFRNQGHKDMAEIIKRL
jgi:hypothetical protein